MTSIVQRLLVVEDDPDTSELIGLLASQHGMKVISLDDECHALASEEFWSALSGDFSFVVTVGNGVSAMAAFWSAMCVGSHFTGVMVDCALPRLDGFTVARYNRVAEREVRDARRCFLSGYTAYSESAQRSHELEEIAFDAFLRKPLNADGLCFLLNIGANHA